MAPAGSGLPWSIRSAEHGVAILTADLDGDGHLDLVTGDDAGRCRVGVMLSAREDGHSGPRRTTLPAGNTHTIATGDLDGDGRLDLVAGGYDEGFVRVFRGPGDGTFGAESQVGKGVLGLSVAVVDLDGDGKPDIIIEGGSGSVGIYPRPLRAGDTHRPRCRRRASSMSSMIELGTTPSRSPTRSTAIDRICSACAFESRSSAVAAAGSRTWNRSSGPYAGSAELTSWAIHSDPSQSA